MKAKLKIQTYDFSHPQSLINMAGTLKKHIIKENLYVKVKGKNYVLVEGWQFAGGLVGVYPVVEKLEDLSTDKQWKYKSSVKLTHKGETVGAGIALCSNKEKGKQSFEEYAVASMAQTRAVGKAYRLLLGWVMKSAGYEATPAEELDYVDADVQESNFESALELAKNFQNATQDEKEQFLQIYNDFTDEEVEQLKKTLEENKVEDLKDK